MLILRNILLCLTAASSLLGATEIDSVEVSRLRTMSLRDLMDIKVIAAGKTLQKVRDIPASVTVVTRDDIERSGFQTMTDILNSLTGISVVEHLNGKTINIRGFTQDPSQNSLVVLINNVQVTDGEILNYYQFPVALIERVEIIRGPMSVMYGSSALMGAINIITVDDTERPRSVGGAGIGTHDHYLAYTKFAGRSDAFSYDCNAFYDLRKGINRPLSEMSTDSFPLLLPEDRTTEGKLDVKNLFLTFSGTFNEFSFQYHLINIVRENYLFFPSLEQGSFRASTNNTVKIGYNKEFSSQVNLNTWCRLQNTTGNDEFHRLSYNSYGNQKQLGKECEAESDLFWKPFTSFGLMSGVNLLSVYEQSYYSNVPPSGLNNNQYNFVQPGDPRNRWAVFTQIDYTLFEKLNLTGGVRLEQKLANELNFMYNQGTTTARSERAVSPTEPINIIPSATAVYTVNEDHVVKAMFGKAIRSNPFSGTDAFDVKNGTLKEHLKPEESYNYELNYLMNPTPQWGSSISLFHLTMNNLVVRKTLFGSDGKLQYWYENSGERVSNGVEVSEKYLPGNGLRFDLGGSYMESRDELLGIDLAFVPHFLGRFAASYNYRTYTVGADLNYTGVMESEWNEMAEVIKNAQGVSIGYAGKRRGDATEATWCLNLNMRAERLFQTGLFADLSIYNLLDQKILAPTNRQNSWATKGTPGRDRTLLLTAGCDF